MNTCAICRLHFEAESPAVLFISAYGTKRVLCESCEALLDRATAEEDTPDKAEALEALSTLANHMKDPAAFEALGEILSGNVADEDDPTPEEEAEIERVLAEVNAEEEAAEEEPARTSVWEYILSGAIGVGMVVFLVWFFFFR